MIKVIFMLGGGADIYQQTGKVPTPKWANEHDGSVFTKTFKTREEYEACVFILNETYVNNWACKVVEQTPPAVQTEACTKQFRAFIWNYEHYPRNVPDEKLLKAYHCDDETEYEIESLTPDELAERINDGSYAHGSDYVRFIEIEQPR